MLQAVRSDAGGPVDTTLLAVDFASKIRAHEDDETALADEASELRAAGVSWSQLADALGVVINSAKERFGCKPRQLEAVRLRRRAGSWLVERPRITVAGRCIVADLREPQTPGGTIWRQVRVCATPAEAVELATYLGAAGAGRYVKRPHDAPAGGNVGQSWRLGVLR